MEGDFALNSILRVRREDSERREDSPKDSKADDTKEIRPSNQQGKLPEKKPEKASKLTWKVDLEQLDDERCVLLIGRKDESLSVAGQAYLRVLRGTIRAAGLTITPENEAVKLFSYPWTPYLLSIEVASEEEPVLKRKINTHLTAKRGALVEVLRSNVSFPRRFDIFSGTQFVPVLDGFFAVSPDVSRPHRFELWGGWDEVLLTARDHGKSARIVIVGPKGCGKSTFARCIVNAISQKEGRALYLETDPGQPDRTPPGTLSLRNISAQEFGPEVSSTFGSEENVKSHFLGLTSAAGDPEAFSDVTSNLVTEAKALGELPLVVNTHGWFKGLGLELTRLILEAVKPTIVVCLERERDMENPLEDLKEKLRILISNDQAPSIDPGRVVLFQLNPTKIPTPELSAKQMREERLSAYFFVGTPIYEVPLEGLRIEFTDAEVAHSEKYAAINGCVVALCHASGGTNRPHLWPCFGLGIVRAICLRRRSLYIMTPVPRSVLLGEAINTLVLSRFIQLPVSSVLQLSSSVEGSGTPYVTSDALSLMSTTMQGRQGLKRRRLSETK